MRPELPSFTHLEQQLWNECYVAFNRFFNVPLDPEDHRRPVTRGLANLVVSIMQRPLKRLESFDNLRYYRKNPRILGTIQRTLMAKKKK